MTEESAEIIELFGVRFSGKRDLTTGRIYVEATPESRAALTRLKEVGQGLIRPPSNKSDATYCVSPQSMDS